MRTFPVFAGLLATVVLAVPIAPSRAEQRLPPHELSRGDVEAWLDGFLPYALQRGDVAGAVVVVVKDGDVLVQKGYGYADVAMRTPVDPARTLFRLGSVAKLFTWTAVMQLVESGKLELDRDVNEYLDFTIPPRDGQPVTLRNLMTHTPGFEEIVKNLATDDPDLLLPLDEYLKTWTPRRIYPPGEVPAYSNYGAALAGYIVQRVSGEPFDDYVEHHLFEPLVMTRTTTRQPLPASLVPHMSKGYLLGSDPPHPFELFGPSPAGGAAASGADMARFMIAWLQEGRSGSARILEPETVRLVFGSRLSIVPPLNAMLLGFMQHDINGRRTAGHAGDTQFFHSDLNLYVDEGVGVFLSMNSSGKEFASLAIRTALINEFADRYFAAPANDQTVDAETANQHARIMVGRYKSSRRIQSTFLNLSTLLSQAQVTVDENGSLVIPALVDLGGQPMKWREVAPFVWEQIDGKERLAAKVENGEVVMFSVDSVSPFLMLQPVRWWESSAWLFPLLFVASAAILLTVAAWPVAAVIRWRHGIAFRLTSAEARTYRLVRIACIGVLATAAGWIGVVQLLSTDLFAFSPRLDPWILLLQIATFAVAAGGTVIALWNARLAWAGQRGWDSRLWSGVLVFSFGMMLWVAIAFNLIRPGTNY